MNLERVNSLQRRCRLTYLTGRRPSHHRRSDNLAGNVLKDFSAPVAQWFEACFDAPTPAQTRAWPIIQSGQSALLVAPTGSGKTLAAFLAALDRLLFEPKDTPGVRILYISPLKALGVDVERNLRAPHQGIRAIAQQADIHTEAITIGVRSGDTSQKARQAMVRNPPEILITTPESLYLLLTSKARQILKSVETVIIDEIHAVAPTKRGSHLMFSLERLEHLRTSPKPMQRIGLSATQRPLSEIAEFLGGFEKDGERFVSRPVEIVDAAERKILELAVEMVNTEAPDPFDATLTPDVEPDFDLEAGGFEMETHSVDAVSHEALTTPSRGNTVWPSMHERLVTLIESHRSTIVFVNSRRLSERLTSAINECAGRVIAHAHHGSLAQRVRAETEDLLKQGRIPAIVATASLELGIDMGAVELVVQVSAPPSVSSALQRVGRAQHHVGGVPKGVTFPKFQGELAACATAARAMDEGRIEATRYPRNPLDILAQHLVATVAMDEWAVDDLFTLCRQSAPFQEIERDTFESVLDMLSGRYPSDEFAELRPRLNWDRIKGMLTPRRGAQRLAVINGGTIPDRGLYGVFLADGVEGKSRRVGELDEEMVFESRIGEVFLLGASSWRVEEITPEKVLVSPAPGEPGKMPFWHGDSPGRPLEFGRKIGQFLDSLQSSTLDKNVQDLEAMYHLDPAATDSLLSYVEEQKEITGVPTHRHIVVERFLDQIGDWRICILSPFGARVHAPWAMAIRARLIELFPYDLDVVWSDDGIVFRVPDGDRLPPIDLFFPEADQVDDLIINRLAETSLFAARFRENAGRALLLPKRRPGGRSPLWALRRRAASLLSVAARFRDFPIVLETYRECLRDQFDLAGLKSILKEITRGEIRVTEMETEAPSPFAASLVFQYVANFMYEGDAPLAERRAQALTIDHERLRALLGEAALRDLLDPAAIEQVIRQVSKLDTTLTDADDIHDLLLSVGAQTFEQLAARVTDEGKLKVWLDTLVNHRRIYSIKFKDGKRYAAAEDAARYRDALGLVHPPGLPTSFLEEVADPLGDLVMRYARTHGPFRAETLAAYFQVGVGVIRTVLKQKLREARLVYGEFLPNGSEQEWCSADVMRRIKRLSLAKLRSQVESVEASSLARFAYQWHRIDQKGYGPQGILDAMDKLQGVGLEWHIWEQDVLPARVRDYQSTDLDMLLVTGALQWQGVPNSGAKGGRITFYKPENVHQLVTSPKPIESELADQVRGILGQGGALFFRDLLAQCGAFGPNLLDTLWAMVWNGEVSNDSLAPLRSLARQKANSKKGGRRNHRRRGFQRSGPKNPPGSEGRWWLIRHETIDETTHVTALTHQLLERHGVLTREAVMSEHVSGGFSKVYSVLKILEERGSVRRGYFVEGLGPSQFCQPGADDRLRRRGESETPWMVLSAVDPANVYGAVLPWPRIEGLRFERASGAYVILHEGVLVAFLSRSEQVLHAMLSEDLPLARQQVESIADGLKALLHPLNRTVIHLEKINGAPANGWVHAAHFKELGFHGAPSGLMLRTGPAPGLRHARR